MNEHVSSLYVRAHELLNLGMDGSPIYSDHFARLNREVYEQALDLYNTLEGNTPEEEAELCLSILVALNATFYDNGRKQQYIQRLLDRCLNVLDKLPDSLLKVRLLTCCYGEVYEEKLAAEAHSIINTWDMASLTPEQKEIIGELKNMEETDYRYPMIEMDGIKRQFKMTEDLKITQGDVRQVQLAKGAILSGFYALLKKAGKEMSELDKVMIAGQFGAHLPADSLIGTGILPAEVKDKLVYVGNSSKTGAYRALLSGQVKREMEELAHHMDYMELGATEGYERLFADCLMFPEVH